MANPNRSAALVSLIVLLASFQLVHAGIIKDIFQKVTNTNNQTEDTVRQSAPICGSGVFSTPNEGDLSPEIIFITNRQSQSYSPREGNRQRQGKINEVAQEFRFHVENVSLSELEHHGFNPEAPVTFLMHGFTSGYPLQGWMSAIVEAYTIDRETKSNEYEPPTGSNYPGRDQEGGSNYESYENRNRNTRRERRQAGPGEDENRRRRPLIEKSENLRDRDSPNQRDRDYSNQRDRDFSNQRDRDFSNQRGRDPPGQRDREFSGPRAPPVEHNLFIVNWNYAARGIVYPRAVANIPIVASYVTRFINDKLIGEANVDPRRVQLIGHSLGAHLAGYIGKNTRSKLGRIYGLDPAGPCFGAVSGPLYPSSKRLAPSDANEVITIQTNSALLGIGRPLGKYSVFVEGGADQPGCKPSGVLKSLSTLTIDGGDFDTVACSHSRAPNLITYRHDQSNTEESCLMVAYACKDWESFQKGQCGVCDVNADRQDESSRRSRDDRRSPMEPVECLRIGLDWQYPKSRPSGGRRPSTSSQLEPFKPDGPAFVNRPPGVDRQPEGPDDYASTRRPNGRNTRRPVNGEDRNRRAAKDEGERREASSTNNSSSAPVLNNLTSFLGRNESNNSSRSGDEAEDVEVVEMFLKTSDTQPYCAFHYQLVLELNEPFEKKPAMSIILQDSQSDSRRRSSGKNSLSSDEFGHKFDDRTYTHLLTSYRKLKKIDHATLMVRDGLKNGHQVLKALHVNYMSHSDPNVRRRWSSRLCPVKTDTDREAITGEGANRFYFQPCGQQEEYSAGAFGRDHSGSHGNREYDNNRERHPTRNPDPIDGWSPGAWGD